MTGDPSNLAQTIAASVCLAVGSGFSLIGGIGMLRLPDFFTRMHAAGVTDTMGAGLIVAGLMIYAGISLVSVKLLFIFVFLFFTSPTSTHALAKTALSARLKPLLLVKEGDSSKP